MIRVPRYSAFAASSPKASAAARGSSKKTGTKAEMVLRRALWREKLRYRVAVKHLPGKPDICFMRAKVAVFCDGDFWHGRNWARRRRKLAKGANSTYWVAKIQRNMERDRETDARLSALGWKVLRFWESDLLKDPRPAVLETKQKIASAQSSCR